MKIDWKKVWIKFDDWYWQDQNKRARCECCGHKEDAPSDEWDVQQRAIQRIVNRALKGD